MIARVGGKLRFLVPAAAVGTGTAWWYLQSKSGYLVGVKDKASGKYDVVIVGGGAAGCSVGSQLLMKQPGLHVAIVEPSENHYYQPGWTLVGSGIMEKHQTVRPQKDCLPSGTTWVKEAVTAFHPDRNAVSTASGDLQYEYLVVTPGIKVYFDRIKGLQETLGKNGVTSNYSYDSVHHTLEFAKKVKSGNFVFTAPQAGGIKCGGAPIKACLLTEDFCTRIGTRQNIKFSYYTGLPACFLIPYYKQALQPLLKTRGVEEIVNHALVEVRGDAHEVVFQVEGGETKVVKFDFLHVVPPMGPQPFMVGSPISNEEGYVEVDKHSTQHIKYPNVFSCGDGSNLPSSKTAAAACSQAAVLTDNLLSHMKKEPMKASYTGYSGCPITVDKNHVIMAEFRYGGVPAETLPFMDQRKPSRTWFYMKLYAFPFMYWNGILKGLWRGPSSLPPIPFLFNNGQPSKVRPDL